MPIKHLLSRCPGVDWAAVGDVRLGCANQAGEDNCNVARTASLLAGLPVEVPGVTVNSLCGSGMQAVADGCRAIASGENSLVLAGGVESMSRAPFVVSRADVRASRKPSVYDSAVGRPFINPRMKEAYGMESLPETAQRLADERGISREAQDRLALCSRRKAMRAQACGVLGREICPVPAPGADGLITLVLKDELAGPSNLESLGELRSVAGPTGSVTSGNSAALSDGACVMLLADARAAARYSLAPMARIIGVGLAGVPPRIMGLGPVPATRRLLELTRLQLGNFDVIEFNEAFAAQTLAALRELGIEDDDPRVNPNGGAIALGHPLGMSGARLVASAARRLYEGGGRYALCAMCIGAGQGIALALERV